MRSTPGAAEALYVSRPKGRAKVQGPAERGNRPQAGGPLPALVDIATVATALGVGVRHVRRLVAERRIPFVKVGHYVRFDPEDVGVWVNERRVDEFRAR